jgi:hypothetical protein
MRRSSSPPPKIALKSTQDHAAQVPGNRGIFSSAGVSVFRISVFWDRFWAEVSVRHLQQFGYGYFADMRRFTGNFCKKAGILPALPKFSNVYSGHWAQFP